MEMMMYMQHKGDQVAPYLWLGNAVGGEDDAWLTSIGVAVVVHCRNVPVASKIAAGFEVVQVSVEDDYESDLLAHFEAVVGRVAAARGRGRGVFVHCQMGRSRSAAVVAAVLLAEDPHATLLGVLRTIRAARSTAAPNASFLLQLVCYEYRLHRDADRTAASLHGLLLRSCPADAVHAACAAAFDGTPRGAALTVQRVAEAVAAAPTREQQDDVEALAFYIKRHGG